MASQSYYQNGPPQGGPPEQVKGQHEFAGGPGGNGQQAPQNTGYGGPPGQNQYPGGQAGYGHQSPQGNAYGGPQGHYPGQDQFGQGQAGNFAGQGGPNQYNPQQQPQYQVENKKGVGGGCLAAMGLGFLLGCCCCCDCDCCGDCDM